MIQDLFFIVLPYICLFKKIFDPSDMYCLFYTSNKTCYTLIKLYLIEIMKYNMLFQEVEITYFASAVYHIYLFAVFKLFFI